MLIHKLFPKLRDLEVVREKIMRGKPVSIGVFCSGNGDRSPLAHQVLQEEFKRKGFDNIQIFSFGTSVTPSSHLKGASVRTSAYARELGYAGIGGHKRRHIGDEDVQREIKNADLLLAVSPSHMALAAEFAADENPRAAYDVLRKTWTLQGFANKTQWTLPFDGLARMWNRLYRGLATKDPYYQPKTPEGEKQFRKMLDEVVKQAKKAASRLVTTS